MKDVAEIKKRLISSELREDAKGVSLDRYPDEGDAKGWCEVHSDDWLHGRLFKLAHDRMDELEKQVDAITKATIMSAVTLLHSMGVDGHQAEEMWKNGEL